MVKDGIVHVHMQPASMNYPQNTVYVCSCGKRYVLRLEFMGERYGWLPLRWWNFTAHNDLRILNKTKKKKNTQ